MDVKKALVTGAAGFIGRHFATHLMGLGYDVTEVDIRSGGLPSVIVEDLHAFLRKDHRVYDVVVHAAYHVGGRATIDGNPSVMAKNVELDAAVFDWAVRTGQRQLLYFSSSAIYPVELQSGKLRNHGLEFFALDEEHACIDLPLLPDARYGWAKLTGEKLAQAAREQGLRVSVVRPFSGYGSDQSRDYPFPSFIWRAIHRQDPFEIWGSELQSRDWVHVDDIVKACTKILEADALAHPEKCSTVNIGTGVRTTMLELAQLICDEVGYSPKIEVLRDKPLGVMERVADPSLLYTYYPPKITLRQGIAHAVYATQNGLQ